MSLLHVLKDVLLVHTINLVSRSTFMHVLILKDVVNFYLSHGSNMHIAFIDISKAFDRVQYDTLLIKLSRIISGATLRLLIVWYFGQTASIGLV